MHRPPTPDIPRRGRHSPAGVVAALTALTIALTLALAACSGGDAGPDPTPTTAPPIELREAVVTCQQWQDDRRVHQFMDTNRSDAQDVVAVYGAPDQPSFAAGRDGNPQAHLPDGPVLDSYTDFFDWACADQAPTTTLAEIRQALFADTPEPTCTTWAAQTPETAARWAWVVTVATNEDAVPYDVFAAACAATPDAALADALQDAQVANAQARAAAEEAAAQAEAEAEAAAAAEAEARAARTTLTWQTTTRLGYTAEHTVRIEPVQSATAAHPDDPGLRADNICGLDPTTDAVIPIWMQVTNTTSGYDAMLSSRFAIRVGTGWNDPAPETVRLAVAAEFSDGPSCEEPDQPRGGLEFGFARTESAATGEYGLTHAFIVLRDYYSPRYPDGNVADLSRILIRGVAHYDADDPVELTSTTEITLDGIL